MKITQSLKGRLLYSVISAALLVAGCGGGGSGGKSGGANDGGCDGSCARLSLSQEDVTLILRRAISAARAEGVAGTFSVVDRVGNVLALYQMTGAPTHTTISAQIGASGGLEGLSVPSALAAISKAGTGAFLSSQGQAFTSRTASQIVQEHFYPGESQQGGGPLFGVQFSQLPCSDILKNSAGPKPLPLGLSADPGGIPLYKNGDLVGGIGVEVNGLYTVDRNITDFDTDVEEKIALAAAFSFEAPADRRADSIFLGGKVLRYTDLPYPTDDPLNENVEPDSANLLAIGGFSDGTIRAGSVFGAPQSGVIDTARVGVPVSILQSFGEASHSGAPLPGGVELKAEEVDALLDSGILTASRARGAIRRPLDTPARVSIWVVDTNGTPLGFVRSQDAAVFGIDVALQKARTAAFFSSTDASAKLHQAATRGSFPDYGATTQAFYGQDIFSQGRAFSGRGVGNLARPFFPDGIDGNPNGPLSLPFPGQSSGKTFSPFNTGAQLDLSLTAIAAPLSGTIPATCGDASVFGKRLGNGIQIFAGSVPLYRRGILIGAIGVSGDGIDQDDLVAFFGASRKGLDYAGHPAIGDERLGFNAAPEIRSDTLTGPFENVRLRYVNCPEAPFIEDSDQNVCSG